MTYQIGDKLWVSRNRDWERRRNTKDEGHECMVTKVGRKWIYFARQWTADGTVLGRIERFDMETSEIYGGACCSPGHVWPSREAYLQSLLRHKAWEDFRELIRIRHSLPDPDFLYALEKQVATMKMYTPIL